MTKSRTIRCNFDQAVGGDASVTAKAVEASRCFGPASGRGARSHRNNHSGASLDVGLCGDELVHDGIYIPIEAGKKLHIELTIVEALGIKEEAGEKEL